MQLRKVPSKNCWVQTGCLHKIHLSFQEDGFSQKGPRTPAGWLVLPAHRAAPAQIPEFEASGSPRQRLSSGSLASSALCTSTLQLPVDTRLRSSYSWKGMWGPLSASVQTVPSKCHLSLLYQRGIVCGCVCVRVPLVHLESSLVFVLCYNMKDYDWFMSMQYYLWGKAY